MTGITFGVQNGPFHDAVALRDHARKVEDLGYRELFSFDHIGEVDPFLPLLTAAEATSTLRFGPLVVNNEFHNVVLLARTAATFDRLTDGRLTLGLGSGYMQSEHDAADIQLRPPGRRVTRFLETMTVLRSLLDTGSSHMKGREVTVNVEDLGVRPSQTRVPFLIGAHGQRMVSAAAEHADIFQFTGLTHDPESGAPSAGGFSEADLARRSQWLGPIEHTDGPERSALVQATAVHSISSEVDAVLDPMSERTGLSRAVLDNTPFVLAGSPTQVQEKIERLREQLGITHYVVRDAEMMAPLVAALA